MTLRTRGLPPGWYPDAAPVIERTLSGFLSGFARGTALACVAPHAGWYYSGAIAARAIAELDPRADVVVVFGGHLSGGSAPLLATEDGFQTPLGDIPADAELREAVASAIPCGVDRNADNTVEVMLPMIRFLFPSARVFWMRLGAGIASYQTGKTVAAIAGRLGRKTVAIGSTDLTHYGPNYGFQPHGGGEAALEWVRSVNDAAFLNALLEGDGQAALDRAVKDSSACSPGAAIGAMGFAAELGAASSVLLAYGTSADIAKASSFVGYGAVAWSRPG
jgi:MEMO1 family protein